MAVTYGLPYIGSKRKLAERIIDVLPQANTLYDLFCGGGAITCCASTYNIAGTPKYKQIVANDINSLVVNGLETALRGGFADENRWISREDFFRLKDTDFYVACCFSFGNNYRTYAYEKKIEPYKRAYHYAVMFGQYNDFMRLTGIDLSGIGQLNDWNDRRLQARKMIAQALKNGNKILKDMLPPSGDTEQPLSLKHLEGLYRIQAISSNAGSLERLVRIEHLERMQNLHSLKISNCDYRQVQIETDSVIYCDIPYANTHKYVANKDSDFDYPAFFDWCRAQTVPVYVSSYNLPDNVFECVAEWEHRSTLSSTANNKVTERLYRVR